MNRRCNRSTTSPEQSVESSAVEELTIAIRGFLTRRMFGKYLILALPTAGATLFASQTQVAEASHKSFWELDGNTLHSNNFLGSTNDRPLIFKTNNKTRMTITEDGKVGIGTTTAPFAKLHVRSNDSTAIAALVDADGPPAPALIVASLSAAEDGIGLVGTTNSVNGIGIQGQAARIGVKGVAPEQGVTGVARPTRNSPSFGNAGVVGIADVTGGPEPWSGTFGVMGIHRRTATGRGAAIAGYFVGAVFATEGLIGLAGQAKIDHPLDPETKYLSHMFVGSPDMINVYNGNITLGANGTAVVDLPPYFEAFNRDFRYQLTCIGSFAPVYISEEIQNNRFTIAGGTPGMKVSWQVTGIRRDSYAEAHPNQVEEDKPDHERGTYLAPVEYGQPETKQTYYKQIQQVLSGAELPSEVLELMSGTGHQDK